ncbi:hypothetical protein R1sor_012437 [Riccia sorocarpa]|uniref:Uncharacterized protein n=1 Tax=Riccia sorocarpa TaxID=122646 RepID=A0ABD3I4I2_9MARC
MEYGGDEHCPEREEQDECEEEEISLRSRREASKDSELKAASKFVWRTGPDSCCSSSCADCCDSSLFARQSQLFQQLQELRLQYLADLWNILGKFKAMLDNHFDDTAVKFIIQEHIDVLQRMVAPMVAQKEMLASWLTVGVLYQLRRQANSYLETFKNEKFQGSFDKLVIRIARRETGECFVNTKTRNYARLATRLIKSPESDYEQRDIYRSFIHRSFEDGETCANVTFCCQGLNWDMNL